METLYPIVFYQIFVVKKLAGKDMIRAGNKKIQLKQITLSQLFALAVGLPI